MGAGYEREHEWISTTVLSKKLGLHDEYATGDQYGDGEIEHRPRKRLGYQTPNQILQVRGCASYLNPRKFNLLTSC